MNRTWLEPWSGVSPCQKIALQTHLQRALKRHHSLFGLKLDPIGWRFGTDEVLFRTDTNRLLVVSLAELESPESPLSKLKFYGSWMEFSSQKMVVDHSLG